MTTQANLLLNQGNDETVALTITQSDGSVFDLTGTTVNFYIKPSAMTPDSDSRVVLLSTTTGGVTVTDAKNGLVTVSIPHANLAAPVARFWRCDVVSGGQTHTAFYGLLSVRYTGI